jgi:hypothetical protein
MERVKRYGTTIKFQMMDAFVIVTIDLKATKVKRENSFN